MFAFKDNRIAKISISLFLALAFVAPQSAYFTGTALGPFLIAHAQEETNLVPQTIPKGNTQTIAERTLGQRIGNILLTTAAYITWIGGMMLETAVDKLVIGMGSFIQKGNNLGTSINNSWALIRDICNLVFIFGFIYVGFRTIIDPEGSEWKRFLSRIIIGALLINFSLFFAKIIIDFSNYVAYLIYNAMAGVNGQGNIAATFADLMGISGYYSVPDANTFAKLTAGGTFWFFIMGAIMFLVAAFVLGAGGILLIVRFIALLLLMVFSPILFAATVFPQTAAFASRLWKELISYSFFAPIYLLLLFVSISILGGVTGSMGIKGKPISGALTDPTQGPGGSMETFGVVLNFAIVILFLIFALQIASRLGVKGGDMAISIGNNLRQRGQKLLTSTAYRSASLATAPVRTPARALVGKATKASLKAFDKWQAKDKKGFGKGVQKTMEFLNWDRSFRSGLESGQKVKFGMSTSWKEDQDYQKERKARLASTDKIEGFKAKVAGGTKDGKLVALPPDKQIEFERAIADASVKDFEELEQAQREAIVGIMTQSQIEGLQKSEKLNEKDKKALGTKRQDYFKEFYKDNKEKLSKASSDHLETLGEKYLSETEHAVRLTSSQMDDLRKKFTPTEFDNLSMSRENALKSLLTGRIKTREGGGDAVLDHEFLTKQKPGEIAKLPGGVLVKMAKMLPVSSLVKIAQDGTLNKEDQKKIREAIIRMGEERLDEEGRAHNDAQKDFLLSNPIGKQFGK
jgi:hypothetical protein